MSVFHGRRLEVLHLVVSGMPMQGRVLGLFLSAIHFITHNSEPLTRRLHMRSLLLLALGFATVLLNVGPASANNRAKNYQLSQRQYLACQANKNSAACPGSMAYCYNHPRDERACGFAAAGVDCNLFPFMPQCGNPYVESSAGSWCKRNSGDAACRSKEILCGRYPGSPICFTPSSDDSIRCQTLGHTIECNE